MIAGVKAQYPDIAEHYLVQEMIREMIGAMVNDVLAEAGRRIADLNPQSVDDIRHAKMAVVAFSPAMEEKVDALRAFLFDRMYRHYTVMRVRLKGRADYKGFVRCVYGAVSITPHPLARTGGRDRRHGG